MNKNKLMFKMTVMCVVFTMIVVSIMLINAYNIVKSVPIAVSHIPSIEDITGTGMEPMIITGTENIYVFGMINGVLISFLIMLTGYGVLRFKMYKTEKLKLNI